MKTFVCGICGYVTFENVPDNCPICFAPKEKFKENPEAIVKPKDPNNLTEGDKKHIPVITVVRKCGLFGEGCIDVHAKVGEIKHVMEEKHFIRHVDFYLNYKYIARAIFTPVNVNPAACVHLPSGTGKLTVIENCNIHGNWMSEVSL